ncbi:N-acetylmannosamine-6-phosphate 2-epimerase [Alicyclobacillus sp. SO9]|uniref:N-acetylmannosamine-6-phosphate 2-epimerase n=1 Tax=Alicyclobacillus sp. SO9 TaxID=2665646 RepID=UPI0018E8960D|nr:N-acetylmannosamine-6-phosphate 2-epimerase [Alicyclobacillus sp. SO9]QQE80550.1 N-acetylmannosamine-6-phosphate 2-epimerase [Alicyclobacillus sp. SO9]
MDNNELLESIQNGLIVSCQALDDEPLFGAEIMGRMALAAKMGGAVGIRANGAQDIREIKRVTDLPTIGIVKRAYEGSEVYITPTMREVDEVVSAGADIVAVDATNRVRPGGLMAKEFLESIRVKFPDALVMADISTFAEGLAAVAAGVDIIATTLSGYTAYSRQAVSPDFRLMRELTHKVNVPVIAEGRIGKPEEAVRSFENGVFAVVVGSAITRPQEITRTFVEELQTIRKIRSI